MKNILFICLLLFPLFSFSQQNELPGFIIKGRVNMDTGTVNVVLDSSKAYNPAGFERMTAKINNGVFTIKGNIDYPVWLIFKIGDQYTSGKTPVVTGTQHITLNVDSNTRS